MTAVFFLFLLHLSLGLVGVLAIVPARAGERFFKLCSAGAAAMTTAALGLLLRRLALAAPAGPLPGYPLGAATGLFLLATVVYNRAQHFRAPRFTAPSLALATGAGLLALAGAARSPFELASDLSSTLLLGTAAGAMILGHYYLVVLDLPIAALRRLTAVLIAALIVRTALLALAFLGPGAEGLAQARLVAQGVFSPDGVFVWMRLLFGILGPLSLVWFIWKTVEIRSTQSATGILYVQLFLVLAGELLAKHLRVIAGLPL